ncbi:MAG: hypothetical protein PVF83_12275 [Anaerolineales bacterium]|jgi:hypothetical protein
MKKSLALIGLLILLLAFASPARACEPCYRILTLEETAEAADLIIIGKLAGEGPSTGDYPHGGPDWIDVQVLETLKGKPSAMIRVNSWDGMCAYGIILPDKQDYLIFLEEGEELYNSVEIGCSTRQFPVMDEMVVLENETVPLDELVARLGVEREKVEKDSGVLPVCGWLGFGVVLVGVMFWRNKNKLVRI